jgi:hypothetical protein
VGATGIEEKIGLDSQRWNANEYEGFIDVNFELLWGKE